MLTFCIILSLALMLTACWAFYAWGVLRMEGRLVRLLSRHNRRLEREARLWAEKALQRHGMTPLQEAKKVEGRLHEVPPPLPPYKAAEREWHEEEMQMAAALTPEKKEQLIEAARRFA